MRDYEAELNAILARCGKANGGEVRAYLAERRKDNCKLGTLFNQAQILQRLARRLAKPFAKVTAEEMNAYLLDSGLGERTRSLHIIVLRAFYKSRCPAVAGIVLNGWKPKKFKPKVHAKDELLTDSEVLRILDAAPDTLARTAIAVLADTGVRLGELLSFRLGWVKFNTERKYAVIGMKEAQGQKTGPREVFVDGPTALKWLRRWVLEEHPDRNNPAAPLFPSRFFPSQPLSHTTFRTDLAASVRRAGIAKKVTAHLFRYGVGTKLAANSWGDVLQRKAMGWADGSTMPSFYAKVDSTDVIERRLQDRAKLIGGEPADDDAETAEDRLARMAEEMKALLAEVEAKRAAVQRAEMADVDAAEKAEARAALRKALDRPLNEAEARPARRRRRK